MRITRTPIFAVVGAALLVTALSACDPTLGNRAQPASPSPAVSQTAQTEAPPSASPSVSPSAAPAGSCQDALTISWGYDPRAGYSSYFTVRNPGPTSCSIVGFPAVQILGPGDAVYTTPVNTADLNGVATTPVNLAPTEVAYVELIVTSAENSDAGSCGTQITSTNFKITLSGATAPKLVPTGGIHFCTASFWPMTDYLGPVDAIQRTSSD